jgi:hypothetical protein
LPQRGKEVRFTYGTDSLNAEVVEADRTFRIKLGIKLPERYLQRSSAEGIRRKSRWVQRASLIRIDKIVMDIIV